MEKKLQKKRIQKNLLPLIEMPIMTAFAQRSIKNESKNVEAIFSTFNHITDITVFNGPSHHGLINNIFTKICIFPFSSSCC